MQPIQVSRFFFSQFITITSNRLAASVEECVSTVLKKYGRIDGAANCAGSILLKPAHITTEDEFSEVATIFAFRI